MTEDQPTQPIVRAAKQASVHLAKAVFEVIAAGGAIVTGVRDVVRSDDADPDEGPQHVPVE